MTKGKKSVKSKRLWISICIGIPCLLLAILLLKPKANDLPSRYMRNFSRQIVIWRSIIGESENQIVFVSSTPLEAMTSLVKISGDDKIVDWGDHYEYGDSYSNVKIWKSKVRLEDNFGIRIEFTRTLNGYTDFDRLMIQKWPFWQTLRFGTTVDRLDQAAYFEEPDDPAILRNFPRISKRDFEIK